jgi:hypothetical protein
MTLDALDQAFVTRWQQRLAAGVQPPLLEPDEADKGWTSSLPGEPLDQTPAAQGASPASPRELANPDLVTRLLGAGRDQWEMLAAEVEAARLAGHRVIAVTGGEQGEGRSTLVACLAKVLRDRGRDVIVLGSTAELSADDADPADGGRLHDKRIVLVDAGAWFRPGPIRRHRLLVATLGCDAAILVRRAGCEPAAAWAAALAAVGVTPLGEVVTFAAPSPSPLGAP